MNREVETVKHLHTYQHKGVRGVLERQQKEKKARKCIYKLNIHNFQKLDENNNIQI